MHAGGHHTYVPEQALARRRWHDTLYVRHVWDFNGGEIELKAHIDGHTGEKSYQCAEFDKLSQILDEDEADFLEKALDEDCQLNFLVEDCLIELDQFNESLCPSDVRAASQDEPSNATRLVDIQESMKDLMRTQIDQQLELLKNLDRKGKVNPNSLSSKKLGGEAKRAVAGLARSNENYEIALRLLHERYGNQQEIVDLHYKALMNVHSPLNKVESLRSFIDTTEKHLRSLEVLGENVNQHVFVSMIRTKLPEEVLRQLEFNKEAKAEWTLTKLREQLKNYVVACERADKKKVEYQSVTKVNPLSHVNGFKPPYRYPPTTGGNRYSNTVMKQSSAESLFASEKAQRVKSENKPYVCKYCSRSHWSDECTEYRTVDERKRKIKGCCFKCLKSGHMANECKTSKACVYCGEFNQHHRSLCLKKFSTKGASTKTNVNLTEEVGACVEDMTNSGENVMVSVGETVFMQIATTEVKKDLTNTDYVKTRLLLDCGSQRTYITKSLADKLGLKPKKTEELKVVTFGSTHSKNIKTELTTLYLKLKNGQYIEIKANIVPVISGNIQRKTLNIKAMSDLDHLVNSVELADTIPRNCEMANVELLLGNDYYLDIVLSQKLEVTPGLYLLSSKLGWILAGRTTSEETDDSVPNMLILTHGSTFTKTNVFQCVDSVLESKPELEDFWSIEAIGVKDKPDYSDDDTAMQMFKKNIKFQDGRYQVTWPWKNEIQELPKNRELAYGRLKSCVKKLKGKPDFLQKYNSVIQDQFQKGIIKKVEEAESDGLQHYLPHHAVVNLHRTSTKVRVVFDASAKLTKDSNSLNDCLYRGPVLLHDLCGLLMRFRLHKVAMVSDIEKAFLQVGLQTSQRDVTRFFWIKDVQKPEVTSENLQVFRFCRVPFGVISSPFLLGATVENHLDSYESDVSQKLKGDIYVDNIVTGANSDKVAIDLYKTAKSIFNDASMNLREWLTNSEEVNKCIPTADLAEPKEMKVLGHIWDHKSDKISVKEPKVMDDDCPTTKRNILKRVASVFDPIGLFSPVVLQGKVLLQELWSRGFDWDDSIDDEKVRQCWSEIDSELKDIPKCKVNRCLANSDQKNMSCSLLCFCDASKSSYAAAVYLHQDGQQESRTDLLFAKTRLAPVKEMTIP
ncbi:uncharacterized protein LOC128202884 [Mya arenaria]|uniref:uncharacterized protein LOC128202884 n=1 Tax=Mya arenaria TaxID=6604 RepID=UPI0022E83A95|nr:uncharacterized protein LOC128202884 [Mya arenaria]